MNRAATTPLQQLFYSTVALALATSTVNSIASAQHNINPEAYYRAPSTMYGKTVILPIGTTFEGRMDSSIGSKISHVGQRFTITLSTPVLANGTDVIIPAGSQIIAEVVEAISSGSVPHEKSTPKPNGKLRVQLSRLKTPAGIDYPLVASLAGETTGVGRRSESNPDLGSSVGYVGSATSFEAVAPGVSDNQRGRNGRGPQVVTKQQVLRDAIYGMGDNNRNERWRNATVRSLVKRNHDLYIDSGSPVTIRLDAPFKIGVNPVNPGELKGNPAQEPVEQFPGEGSNGRRFSTESTPPSSRPADTTSTPYGPRQTPAAPPAPAVPDNF